MFLEDAMFNFLFILESVDKEFLFFNLYSRQVDCWSGQKEKENCAYLYYFV